MTGEHNRHWSSNSTVYKGVIYSMVVIFFSLLVQNAVSSGLATTTIDASSYIMKNFIGYPIYYLLFKNYNYNTKTTPITDLYQFVDAVQNIYSPSSSSQTNHEQLFSKNNLPDETYNDLFIRASDSHQNERQIKSDTSTASFIMDRIYTMENVQ